MTPDERARMNSLCLRIQEEQDYRKFATLLRELSVLIGRKEQRRFKHQPKLVWQRSGPWKTVPAVVSKIVKSAFAEQAEKIEISIPSGDDLFRELRIENEFTDVDGGSIALTDGTHVDVTFEAETKDHPLGSSQLLRQFPNTDALFPHCLNPFQFSGTEVPERWPTDSFSCTSCLRHA